MARRRSSLIQKATDDDADSYRATMARSKVSSFSSTESDVFVPEENLLKGCMHPSQSKFVLDPENALEKCKKCCEKGQCSIKELLEACEKAPDAILAAYRKKGVTPYAKDCVSYIKQTRGEKFGDPKYHYLMVDVSTSIEFPEATKRISYGIVETLPIPSPPSERKMSLAEGSSRSGESEGTKSIPLSDIYEPSEDQTTSTSRQSAVSWSSGVSGLVGSPGQSRQSTNDSIENVVLKATVDAEKFRHSPDARKHYSHLGEIVREEQQKSANDSKRSTIESKELGENKSLRNCFGFKIKNMCPKTNNKRKLCSTKKTDRKGENGNRSDDSDEESQGTKRSSLDSYKRRSSPVEHAVFENDKAINRYLSNM